MDARSIIASTLALRRSHRTAPARDIFDLVMQGAAGQAIDFADPTAPGGSLAWPTAPFGQMVAEAFDTGMPPGDWFLIDLPDPKLRKGLRGIWRTEVIAKVEARYRVKISGA